MPIIGKLHELSFYGFLSAIISLLTKLVLKRYIQ